MEHYSKALGRNFQDDDWLTISEVKEVISANSGRVVGIKTVGSFLRRAKNIHRREVNAQVKLYLYGDIKSATIPDQRGRRLLDDPSPRTLSQREFYERNKERLAQERARKRLAESGK